MDWFFIFVVIVWIVVGFLYTSFEARTGTIDSSLDFILIMFFWPILIWVFIVQWWVDFCRDHRG